MEDRVSNCYDSEASMVYKPIVDTPANAYIKLGRSVLGFAIMEVIVFPLG